LQGRRRQRLQTGFAEPTPLLMPINLQRMQRGAVFIGPMRQAGRAFKQQESDGNVIGEQGEAFDGVGAGIDQQAVQRAVDVAGLRQLLGMHLQGVELLFLHKAQRLIGHEASFHRGRIPNPTKRRGF